MQIRFRFSLVVAILLLCACSSRTPLIQTTRQEALEPPVTVYFVLHAEMNLEDPSIPLTPEGHARAAQLVRTFSHAHLTHVFASHTLRARQTVMPVAEAHDLPLGVYPPLGSEVDGQTVGDASPSPLAIGPVADALSELPPGSHVLFAGNSRNLLAIMNRLGVREGSQSNPCLPGEPCVPCINDTCLPKGFDGLWILTGQSGVAAEQLLWLKY